MLFSQLFFDGCTEAEVACSWLFKERLEKLDLSPKQGRAARSLQTEQIPFTNPAVQVRRAGTKTASRSSVGGGRPPSLCYHGCFLFFFSTEQEVGPGGHKSRQEQSQGAL